MPAPHQASFAVSEPDVPVLADAGEVQPEGAKGLFVRQDHALGRVVAIDDHPHAPVNGWPSGRTDPSPFPSTWLSTGSGRAGALEG